MCFGWLCGCNSCTCLTALPPKFVVHTCNAHSGGMSNSSKNSIFLQGWVHSSKDELEIWSCIDFTSYSITLFYTKFTFGGAIFILLKAHNKYCWSELLSIIRVSGGLTICDIPPWMSRLNIKYLVYRHGKRIDPGFAKKMKLVSSKKTWMSRFYYIILIFLHLDEPEWARQLHRWAQMEVLY